jgi:biotin carboxyl carrier protein
MSSVLFLLLPLLSSQGTEERTLSFAISGKVKEVLVKPGDTVKKGQVLVRLENWKAKNKVDWRRQLVEVKELFLWWADSDYRHSIEMLKLKRELWPEKIHLDGCWCVVKAILRLQQSRLAEMHAKYELEKAEHALASHSLHSVHDGMIAGISVQQDDLVKSGQTVITLKIASKKP